MVQSNGTLRRISSAVLSILMLGTATGCDLADRLRPDLNFSSEVRVFPNEEGVVDGDVQPGSRVDVWPNGSPNTGNFSYHAPARSTYSENFVGTPADMIGAVDYSTYLREQVYEPIAEILEGLDPDITSKIYFKVGHAGYDMIDGEFRRSSGWTSQAISGRAINTSRMVGGEAMLTLAVSWLGDLDRNTQHQAQQIKQAQDTLRAYVSEEDMGKSWYELADSNVPYEFYRMFGREGVEFKTLQEYYDALATDPYKNIPNYYFYYYTGDTTTDKIYFNKVPSGLTEPYQAGVSLKSIEKLFRTNNQYLTRDREIKTETATYDGSLVRYYLDGYNKTVIFIGTTAGDSLQEVLDQGMGEEDESVYKQIFEIINGAYVCTDCDKIRAIKPEPAPEPSVDPSASPAPSESVAPAGPDYSGFRVIPAGTKGVD